MEIRVAWFKPTATYANNAFMDLIPSQDVEIHNIYAPAAAALEYYQHNILGAAAVTVLFKSASGPLAGINYKSTNGVYIRVKNVSGGSIEMGADGEVMR
jgi:hypothetical protein